MRLCSINHFGSRAAVSLFSAAAAVLAALPSQVFAAEYNEAAGAVQMHNVRAFYREGHCNTFPVATLPLSGLAENSRAIAGYRARAEWGMFMVGFENIKRKGADPLPCNDWELDAVQIAVKFGLEQVSQAIRNGERIQSAFLSWERRNSAMGHIPDRLERRPFRACRGEGFVAGNATRAWSGGYTETKFRPCSGPGGCLFNSTVFRSAMMPFTNRTTSRRVSEAPDPNGGAVRHQMNVTRIVNSWFARNPSPNHGIILSPPTPPALGETVDESSLNAGDTRILHCWRMLKNIRLRVVTTP